jgi:hypothetical protein
MTNWKERYDALAKLTQEIIDNARKQELIFSRINSHVGESYRLDLRDRNVHRYLRLTQTVELTEEYQYGQGATRTFEAGTLVDAEIHGKGYPNAVATVYLDNDGDGYLHFPAKYLEEVELNDGDIDWDKVVNQG